LKNWFCQRRSISGSLFRHPFSNIPPSPVPPRPWELTGDAGYPHQADAAIRTTARALDQSAGTVDNYGLCHGTLGNAELMILGAQVLRAPHLWAIAERTAGQAIRDHIQAGPGVPVCRGATIPRG
jgi:hypothetical protein